MSLDSVIRQNVPFLNDYPYYRDLAGRLPYDANLPYYIYVIGIGESINLEKVRAFIVFLHEYVKKYPQTPTLVFPKLDQWVNERFGNWNNIPNSRLKIKEKAKDQLTRFVDLALDILTFISWSIRLAVCFKLVKLILF